MWPEPSCNLYVSNISAYIENDNILWRRNNDVRIYKPLACFPRVWENGRQGLKWNLRGGEQGNVTKCFLKVKSRLMILQER